MNLLDRAIDFEARNEKLISFLLATWLFASCAVYARFIVLPDIPHIDEGPIFFWGSAAFNAVWWGFVRPALQRRKQARKIADRQDEG